MAEKDGAAVLEDQQEGFGEKREKEPEKKAPEKDERDEELDRLKKRLKDVEASEQFLSERLRKRGDEHDEKPKPKAKEADDEEEESTDQFLEGLSRNHRTALSKTLKKLGFVTKDEAGVR